MYSFPMNLPKEFLIGSFLWAKRNPEWMEIVKKYPHHGRRYGTEEERTNLRNELLKLQETSRDVGHIKSDDDTNTVYERIFVGSEKEAISLVEENKDKRHSVCHPDKELYAVFEVVDANEMKGFSNAVF